MKKLNNFNEFELNQTEAVNGGTYGSDWLWDLASSLSALGSHYNTGSYGGGYSYTTANGANGADGANGASGSIVISTSHASTNYGYSGGYNGGHGWCWW